MFRRVSLLGLTLAVLALAGLAPMVRAELPPLVDRELFFGDPEISAAQVSPDGMHISFIKPYHDVRNIYVKGIDEPFSAARPLTADERPVPGYFWSEDGKYVLYVQDKGGNENFHVYSVDPTAAPEAESGVPPARDLTPVDGVRALIYSVPEKTPGYILVGLNDRDATYHDVYRVNIASGERQLVLKNTQKVGFYLYDLEGTVKLAVRQTDDGGTEMLRVEGENLVPCYSCTYEESCMPARVDKDGKHIYIETNKGSDVDLTRLMLLDPLTGQTELVESDPQKEVDFGGAWFDDTTEELIATSYQGDRLRIYPRDKQLEKDLALLHKQLPDGELSVSSSTEDMRYHIVTVQSDVDPGSAYLYDRKAGKAELLYRSRPDLPSESLAPMQAVRYKARDGLEIPAYLTLPKGVAAKNLPVIIHPHGGPWARDEWGYNGYAQFLANRGYAVLQPNFRSSSGYGKNFLNAGNHTWGTGAMQNDLSDGVKWLIDQGIADPKRVGIFGGSYGGYATLAGVTFTPELYACGVPVVAPSNIITLIESFPAYWRPFLVGSWYKRVGDPANAADRADMEARSPLNFVDRIQAPLLVVHGANDPRVKQAESDRIVIALRDRGRPVEYMVAPDEGHGYRAPQNRLAMAAAMEKFLAKYLGGRAQESVPTDLAAKLDELMVDVNTLTLSAVGSGALLAEAKTAPLPKADGSLIKPATLTYTSTLEMMGQKLELTTIRSIESATRDGKPCWRVTDNAKSPMGNMTDAFEVEKGTLLPLYRDAKGMGTMLFTYTSNSIKGEMGGGGQTLPVDLTLDAPVLGDGPALELALAGLPLVAGYTTTIRVFEPTMQKVRPMKVEVKSAENITVVAGAYDTFLVELTPLDGETGGEATLNVMQAAPHHVVKGIYKFPAAMGGGTMHTELSMSGAAPGEED